MTRPRYDDLELHVPEPILPEKRRTHALDFATAIALVVIAVLIVVHLASRPAPSEARDPGQLHGAGLTGLGLRGAPDTSSDPVPEIVKGPGAPRYAGTATWYCGHGSRCTRGYGPRDMVAAIDTDLGFRKGQSVVVRYRDRAVTVKLVDVCGCAGERLIDLTSGAFSRLAPLGLGVLPVTVESASGIRLPATDTR